MPIKNKTELVKQIEAYGLKHKLAELVRKQEARRPFHHLPKQFSSANVQTAVNVQVPIISSPYSSSL